MILQQGLASERIWACRNTDLAIEAGAFPDREGLEGKARA